VASADFNHQVDGIVARTAIYRSSAWAQAAPLDDQTRNALAQVAKTPSAAGFTSVIVADDNWSLTYDRWALNPPDADGEIASKVQTHWLLLTGIQEPAPPAP
jgi:hypothetical protein